MTLSEIAHILTEGTAAQRAALARRANLLRVPDLSPTAPLPQRSAIAAARYRRALLTAPLEVLTDPDRDHRYDLTIIAAQQDPASIPGIFVERMCATYTTRCRRRLIAQYSRQIASRIKLISAQQ